MRVIHLSYTVPQPNYSDPEAWLHRISFSVIVMESMTAFAEVIGIYHIKYRGEIEKNKVKYYFTGLGRWQLLLPIQFNRTVQQLKPDVVIVHGLIFSWQVIMLRWQMGKHVKIIAQHHAERPLRDIRQYIQRWADRYIMAYLFSSLDLGRLWVEKKQIRNESKIKVVMGTSSTFYPLDKKLARTTVNVPDEKIFLWVGRLNPNKDPLIVVKAFNRFAKLHADVSLFMIYSTVDQELLNLMRVEGLTDKIHFVGPVNHDQLQCWYNSADFIVSSSHYEGSGIAVCEAMSCGCIPIVTNIPSFVMMTDNGNIGLLYPAGHEDSLFNELEKSLLLNQQKEREKVLTQFHQQLSGEANARKIMEIINESSASDK